MQALKKKLKAIISRAEAAPAKAAGRARILRMVEKLNTKGQLFQGIDAEGTRLDAIGGPYSPYTVALKMMAGQPIDRVTLKDTGRFYDSFIATAQKDGILIRANTIKEEEDLQDRWGNNLLGLTEESLNALRAEIAPLLISEIKKIF